MGESKRRKNKINNFEKKEQRIFPQVPISKHQVDLMYRWTTNAAWAGIGVAVLIWFTVHLFGPNFGWWTLK